ncbi:MAG: hypothetical protein AMXMBFR48_07040 [Ignavibacteriales bacterium]
MGIFLRFFYDNLVLNLNFFFNMSKAKTAIRLSGIEIEVDKITSSIQNLISGDILDTEVVMVSWTEINKVTQNSDWLFDWKIEFKRITANYIN